MEIKQFAQEFITFAHKNGISARPEIIQHNVTRIPGYVEQWYLLYRRDDAETHEISVNLSFTGGDGQKDAEVIGLREFFGLSSVPAVRWSDFVKYGDAAPVKPGAADASPEPAKTPIGPEFKPGCHRNMFNDFPPGAIYIESGVKYIYVAETPFMRYWQRAA